jgi:hypothetical protein
MGRLLSKKLLNDPANTTSADLRPTSQKDPSLPERADQSRNAANDPADDGSGSRTDPSEDRADRCADGSASCGPRDDTGCSSSYLAPGCFRHRLSDRTPNEEPARCAGHDHTGSHRWGRGHCSGKPNYGRVRDSQTCDYVRRCHGSDLGFNKPWNQPASQRGPRR